MSAEYDGSIKLGVSVSADTKSVIAELGALRKQIVDMFSSVDKSLAGGSGSFLNLETLLTKISEDISNIGKAISVLPDSKVVQIVETVKQVSSSAKDGATAVEQASQDATKSIDLELASAEDLYQALRKVRAEKEALIESQLALGKTSKQIDNSVAMQALKAQEKMLVEELRFNRSLSDTSEYQPAVTVRSVKNPTLHLEDLKDGLAQAQIAITGLQTELSNMNETDDGFEEKTKRVHQLSNAIDILNTKIEAEKISLYGASTSASSDASATESASKVGMLHYDSDAIQKEMEIYETAGEESAHAFWSSYSKVQATEGDKVASEFAKGFGSSSGKDDYVYGFEISRMQTELRELQSTIKQFNSGKIELSDEDLGRTLSRIQQLKTDIALATKSAQHMSVDTPMDEDFADLIDRANLLQAKLKEFNNTGFGFANMEDAQRATAELREVQQAIADYKTAVNSTPQELVVQGDLGKMIEEYNQLNQAVKKFKNTGIGMTDADFGSAVARMDELKKKITEMQAKLASTPKTGFAGLLQNMTTLGTRIGEVSKIAGNMNNKVGGAMTKLAGKVKALIGWFRKLRGESSSVSVDITKGFKKAMTTFAKVAVGVRSLYMLFRRLRTSVVEALNEMSKQIPEVNAQMSSFKTALNQVKGSLGTAFQPILTVILPVLTRLLNMLNSAMNAIGQFFAVLSGQNKIFKYTAAQVDYAESLGGTADKAKEAKKALMGFDELNVLPDNSDSGGGGAGGGGTYEEVAVDPNSAISSFAQMMKDAWESADFFDVGQFLGTKLRDGLNVLDEMITTKGYALAEKIGKVFATLINGIVSVGGLADSIGRTLADVINMAMIGLNTFFTATDWLNVGKFVADTIMSFFDNIDWELLGQTVGNYIMMFANSFYGFVTNIDFESIGQYIATAINNIFDVMGQIDETGLNGWQKIGQSISDAIRGVLNTIITALQSVSWDEIGTAIGELIGSIDWAGIAWDVTRLVGSLVSAIAEAFWNWAETEPISAAIAAMVGVAVVGAQVGPVVANALPFLAKLGEVFSLVAGGAGTLKEAMTLVFGAANTLFAGIGSIVAGAALAVTNFVSMFVNGFSWIKEILMVVGIAIAAVGAVILGAPAAVAAVVAGIVAAVATLVVLIKEHWTEICNWFTETWKAFKKGWTEFWDGVGEILSNCWSAIKTGVSNAVNAVRTTITTVVNNIRTWWTTAWTAIQTTVTNIFNGIKTAISNAINTVKTTITNVLNAIKTGWTNALNAIKTTTTNIFNGIKTSITNVINGIKTGITNGLNAVKAVWSNIWNAVKSTTVSIFNGIRGTIKGVVNGIIGFINGMVRGVVSGLNAMINAMNKLSFDVPDWVPSIGGKKFGFSIRTISAPQIPYLAKGAVLPPNKPFTAVVGDQKHGTNIEAPLATIQEAVAEEMTEFIDAMMTGFQAVVDSINNKDLEVSIGDTAIGKAAERYRTRQALVRGTT